MFCDLALTLSKNATTAQHIQLLSTAHECRSVFIYTFIYLISVVGYRVVACHQEISSKEFVKKVMSTNKERNN
jgi:hypothetical protein